MATLSATIIAGLVTLSPILLAQQSPSPQPTQVQTQSAPCATTPTAPKPPQGIGFKFPSKLQQAINRQRAQIQNQTGISVPPPSLNQTPQRAQTAHPCPAPTTTSATPAPPKEAELKLPPDTSLTLRCNPLTPSSKGGSGPQTSLTLPDPHDFGLPKPGQWEADSVAPDLSAKTPCFLIKTDPKTNKSFIAQQ